MIDVDLLKRINDRRKERDQFDLSLDELETVQIEARRALCEELGDFFTKEYSITITSGVGTVYNLTGSVNVDLLWNKFGSAVHSDGTDISIMPFGCTSRDLTRPRFQGVYWAVVEVNGTLVTITVWQGDGATFADNGTVTVDFATTMSLANWPVMHESILVAKCLELSVSVKAEAAT